MFPNRLGKPMNAKNLTARSFKPLLECAGLPGRQARTICGTPVPPCCSAKACTPSSGKSFSDKPLSPMDTYSHMLMGMGDQTTAAMERVLS